MPVVSQLLRRTAVPILLAIVTTILVAWGCSMIDMAPASSRSANAMAGDLQLSVSRWDRAGATYVVSEVVKSWSWGPSQATGAPDTPSPGDQPTAWASATPDGQREWLVLEYAAAVIPKSVQVHETYNPGAVDRVTVFAGDGREIDAWRGTDPTARTASSGVSDIPLAVDFPIQKLKIQINSPAVPGWNEIDAVGLIGKDGQVQWARRATASSSYGTPPSTTSDPSAVRMLLPGWGGLEPPSEGVSNEPTNRAVDGRGWPLTALWCERDHVTGYAIGGALGARRIPPSSPATLKLPSNAYTGSSGYIGMFSPASPSLPPALPLHIAWQGLIVDVAFYTIALSIAVWLLVRPWRFAVELSRLRHGRCISCGYDLGYDFPRGCPECGWRRGSAPNFPVPSPSYSGERDRVRGNASSCAARENSQPSPPSTEERG